MSVLQRSEHTPALPAAEQLWQELVLAVRAVDEVEARAHALAVAKQSECEFESMSGDIVRWVTEGVAGAWPFDGELPDGKELFSRFLRASEGASLLKPFDN